MFGNQIPIYNVENSQSDFEKLFKSATSMWLGCDENTYPSASVKNTQCPLLVVNGDNDMLVSRQQAFDLTEQVKDARLLHLLFATHTL